VDGAATWNGFINAFNLDDSFAFNFAYPVEDLKATISASSVELAPNFAIWDAEANNSAWFDNPGNPPSNPNKYVEAISFVEDNSLAGSDLTFIGTVSAFSLDNSYEAVAFIKALDPNNGFATVVNETAVLTATGDFTVSASAAQLQNGLVIQYGFTVTGLIADPAEEANLGTVTVDARTLSVAGLNRSEFKVSPNPSDDVWNINGTTLISEVQVFDVLGKNVLSIQPNQTSTEINASNLKSGLYLARISSTQGTNTIKLIKN
jgi:hypothetical protein